MLDKPKLTVRWWKHVSLPRVENTKKPLMGSNNEIVKALQDLQQIKWRLRTGGSHLRRQEQSVPHLPTTQAHHRNLQETPHLQWMGACHLIMVITMIMKKMATLETSVVALQEGDLLPLHLLVPQHTTRHGFGTCSTYSLLISNWFSWSFGSDFKQSGPTTSIHDNSFNLSLVFYCADWSPASFTLAVIVGSDVWLFRSPMYHTCGDGSSPLCASVVKLWIPRLSLWLSILLVSRLMLSGFP